MMAQAFAPSRSRGCSWLLALLLAIGAGVRSAPAQAPPTPPGPKADDPKAKPAEKPPAAKAAEPEEDDEPDAEVFIDPAAKELMAKFDVLTYTGAQKFKIGGTTDDRSKVLNMVARNENINPKFLKDYIDYFAAELTKRDYLNAIMAPAANAPPNSPQSRGLEVAVDALTKPIIDARFNKNAEFSTTYNRLLFESRLLGVLENNYFSRIDAMIVLGTAGSTMPAALDLYAAQLKKEDQAIWVKFWACRGYTLATQIGTIPLDQTKAINAADALITFLDSDPKLPWPAKVRAIEALGAIRLAVANKVGGKVDVASAIFKSLVDADSPFEVRAEAAWALGMLRLNSQSSAFNFAMSGREIGELAIDLGDQIVEEYDDNQATFEKEKEQAHHLSALLLYQVIPSLSGVDGVNDSGLMNSSNSSLAPVKGQLAKIDEKAKAIAHEAYELIRAGGTSQKDRRNDLDARVADLKAYINQVVPKDRKLVPDGPEFPAVAPRVAGAGGR